METQKIKPKSKSIRARKSTTPISSHHLQSSQRTTSSSSDSEDLKKEIPVISSQQISRKQINKRAILLCF